MGNIKYNKIYYVETNYDIREREESIKVYGSYLTEKEAVNALNNARSCHQGYMWFIRLEPTYPNREEFLDD